MDNDSKTTMMTATSSSSSKLEEQQQQRSSAASSTTASANNNLRLQPQQRQKQQNSAIIKKGFGLHDWMVLLRSAKDIAQRKGHPLRSDITMAEVQTHNKVYDAWIILSNKVYNITPYLPYHPGGESIMQSVLGKDATILFHKYHTWVNIDNLIGPLYLGTLMLDKKNYRNDNDTKTNKNDDDDDDDDDDDSSRDMPYASTNS
jgi:cytochrome b involved in lipid metabolism